MIGTILNCLAILAGGGAGLATKRPLSAANQSALKVFLGVFVVYTGLSLTWDGLHGSLLHIFKQVLLAMLALSLGNVTGIVLRLQKSLNRLGQYARRTLTGASATSPNRWSEGFTTGAVLFCLTPLAMLGSVFDGLEGRYQVFALKAVMDGLATFAFVRTFGAGVVLAALPVLAFQGTLTLGAQQLRPFVEAHGLLDALHVTGGLLVFCVSLIVLELKKVELADYLPSLGYAALFGAWWP